MGTVYAEAFAKAGYYVRGCDIPEKVPALRKKLGPLCIQVEDDGFDIARTCDFIVYSVPIETIDAVVKQYGPLTKSGAIVSGQTSVKTPEVMAFQKYLPKDSDVNIIPCHSMHGRSVSPKGKQLVVINHRSSPEAYRRAIQVFGALESNIVEGITYIEHDRITAETQVATHLAFEAMGTGWKDAGCYPWYDANYASGIDDIKVLMTLRIMGGKIQNN